MYSNWQFDILVLNPSYKQEYSAVFIFLFCCTFLLWMTDTQVPASLLINQRNSKTATRFLATINYKFKIRYANQRKIYTTCRNINCFILMPHFFKLLNSISLWHDQLFNNKYLLTYITDYQPKFQSNKPKFKNFP